MHCRRTLIALLLALAITVPAACGSDGGGEPLSRTTASELRSGLDEVEQNIDAGDCEAATNSAVELEQRAADLPSRVDSDLRAAVEQGMARLGTLVRERCQAEEGSTGPTGPPVAETGPTTGQETTPADEDDQGSGEEKPSKPGKGKKKDENGGTLEPPAETPPSEDDQGQELDPNSNQDSGGAAP